MTTVLKFGGTSVATAEVLERVARIVRGAARPVVVVSATASAIRGEVIQIARRMR